MLNNVNQKRLIFPHQPFHDDFLNTIDKVFYASCFFGVVGPRKRLWRVWGVFIAAMIFAIKVGAVYKLVKLLMGLTVYSVGTRSVTARIAGAMFYGASFFSLVLCWRVSSSWEKISVEWQAVESRITLNVPLDKGLKRQMIFVSSFMAVGALMEHVFSIVSNIDELNSPPTMLMQQYILNSHGFIFVPTDYSIGIAVPVFFMSNVATVLWGFQDLLIVLISMGLTSRYQRLNGYIAKISEDSELSGKTSKALKIYTWRKIRDAYVKQALLVRKVDATIGGLLLLSCSGNFYFICLQLFLGITQGISDSVVKRLYYTVSLGWLCLRFCYVVLAAADVNAKSKLALKYLHFCDDRNYNIEIERLIYQLTKDYVALSGLGFFYIYKGILLQMAASIITYELVLIQFDGKAASQRVYLTINGTKII